MQIGQNTPSSEVLRGFVERIEAIRAQKKGLSQDEALVMAEAKSAGYASAGIKMVVQRRAMKPRDREESEALLDTYMHALGETLDTPLFRLVGRMSVDTAVREEVVEALSRFVPEGGAIVIESGGRPLRLARGADGTVTATEVVERPPPEPKPASGGARGKVDRAPPPEVDDAGAEQLGREAYRANQPIIANPFPFGHAQRPRWDEGWRKESGGDGMGGDDD